MRSVKKEQARWEKWDGVRWPLVKREARREQENGGVWVDAGMEVVVEEGWGTVAKAASGSSNRSLSSLASAGGGSGALRAMLGCGFSALIY